MRKDININSILPVKAKIFYEDNVPYLWYKGKVNVCGKEWFITFPKINLKMESASIISEANFFGKNNTLECTFKPSFFVGDEEIFRIEEVPLIKEEENLFKF